MLGKPYKMIQKVTTMVKTLMWTTYEYSEHTIVLLKYKWKKCHISKYIILYVILNVRNEIMK